MKPTEPPIKTYKILFIGDTSVGKTNLISRFVHNQFSDALLSTICVEQTWTKIPYNNKMVHFEFNDTASQEYLRSNIDSYYEEAECYVIVFDVTKRSTFHSLNNYFDSIRTKYNKQTTKVFLAGNKMDLSNKEISKEEALDYANQKGASIFFTSAKANTCIQDLFDAIYKQFLGNSYMSNKDIVNQANTQCDCCNIF